jgi:hypothetical protein
VVDLISDNDAKDAIDTGARSPSATHSSAVVRGGDTWLRDRIRPVQINGRKILGCGLFSTCRGRSWWVVGSQTRVVCHGPSGSSRILQFRTPLDRLRLRSSKPIPVRDWNSVAASIGGDGEKNRGVEYIHRVMVGLG